MPYPRSAAGAVPPPLRVAASRDLFCVKAVASSMPSASFRASMTSFHDVVLLDSRMREVLERCEARRAKVLPRSPTALR